MDEDNPQQNIITLEDVTFFSNFDSGNMSKAFKTSEFEVLDI